MRNVSGLRATLILTGSFLLSGCPTTVDCPEGTSSRAGGCIPDDAGVRVEGDAMVVLTDGGVPETDGGVPTDGAVPMLDGGPVPMLDGGPVPMLDGGTSLPDVPVDACALRPFYADADGDGFGDGGAVMLGCIAPDGYIEDDTDCDDGAELIHPMATERCDMARLDENCNGASNEGCECYVGETRACPGESEIGECIAGTQTCDATGHWLMCTGTVRPATERCDNLDNDCDAVPDDGPEADAACGPVANGAPDCVLGVCNNVCNSGYADCSTGAGCETALGTAANCTGCGATCGWGCRTVSSGFSCNDPTSISMSVLPLTPQTTCVVRADGTLACWGDDEHGEVGDRMTVDVTRPTRISIPTVGARVLDSAAGPSHSCAVVTTSATATSGNVYCWGDNSRLQLGNGTADSLIPRQVVGVTNVVEVVAGWDYTCAMTTTGMVYCWGKNNLHQLGGSTTTDSATPTRVPPMSTTVDIDAALDRVCAAVGIEGVFCWGRGHTGREAVALPGGLLAVGVATGMNHTCALANTGAVYCWGANDYGQIGNGSTTAVTVPTRVGDFGTSALVPSATEITAGDSYTCVRSNDGRAWCWGYNAAGQLGDGTTATRTTPTAVSSLTGVIDIEAGSASTCALTRGPTDATSAARMWCWGSNNGGELGDGTTTGRLTPVAVTAPL